MSGGSRPDHQCGRRLARTMHRQQVQHDSEPEGGSTLTSAPVSTKKLKLEVRSFKKIRRLMECPVALGATSGWLSRFPTGCRGAHLWALGPKRRSYQHTLMGLVEWEDDRDAECEEERDW